MTRYNLFHMRSSDFPATDDEPTAKTTVTSFRVIEALKHDDTAGVTELADQLDLAKGTVHKHLNTLRGLGYVVKEDRSYRLSVSFLGLGTNARDRLPIYEAAIQPLEDLAAATGEVASLMIPEHGYGIYILRKSDQQPPDIFAKEGDRLPMHATAGGKAILSYTPPEKRAAILDQRGLPEHTENTITDRDALDDELQLTRDRRIAFDRGEYHEDRHCIGYPITDSAGWAIAAITVAGPAERMRQKASSTDFSSIVGSTANSLQNRIGD